MKNLKIVFAFALPLFFLGCDNSTPSNLANENSQETSTISTELDPSQFSRNKKKFVDSVCAESGNLPLESCVCIYDSMNPVLSKLSGENWMDKGMQDIDTWTHALNNGMQECGLEYRN